MEKKTPQLAATEEAICNGRTLYAQLFEMLDYRGSLNCYTNQHGITFTDDYSSVSPRHRYHKRGLSFNAGFTVPADEHGIADGDLHVIVKVPKTHRCSKNVDDLTIQDIWEMRYRGFSAWNRHFTFRGEDALRKSVTWDNERASRKITFAHETDLSLDQMLHYTDQDFITGYRNRTIYEW